MFTINVDSMKYIKNGKENVLSDGHYCCSCFYLLLIHAYIYSYFILSVDGVKYLEISIWLMDTFETGSKLKFRLNCTLKMKHMVTDNEYSYRQSNIMSEKKKIASEKIWMI